MYKDFNHKLIEQLNTPGQLETDPDLIGLDEDGTEFIQELLDKELTSIDSKGF